MVDLAEFRGRIVRIAFRCIAVDDSSYSDNNGNGWYIDDITLPQYAGLEFEDIIARSGVETSICVRAYSSPVATNLEFTVSSPNGDFSGMDFSSFTSRCETVDVIPLGGGEWLVQATTTSSNGIGAFDYLGDLVFTGSVAKSKFTSIGGHSIAGTKATGGTIPYTGLIDESRIVMLAAEPLLEIEEDGSLDMDFTCYGVPSTEYEIQSSPELIEPTWTSNATITTGGDMVHIWGGVSATSNTLFFRAVEK